MSDNSVRNAELFIEFVSSEAGKIISLRVEEKVIEMRFGGLNRGGLARTQLLVNFKESFFLVFGGILLEHCLADPLVLAEQTEELVIGSLSESTDKRCCGYLSVLVYTDIEDIVAVHFVFEPRTAVRDNL